MTNQTPFDSTRLDATKVDFKDLSTAVTYLNDLLAYVDHISSVQMNATLRYEMQQDDTPVGTPFGGFVEARTQWTSVKQAVEDVAAQLAKLREQVQALKDGTTKIADNYRSVEERNAAGAAQISALLDPVPPKSGPDSQGGSQPGPGTQPAATTGSTTTPSTTTDPTTGSTTTGPVQA